MNAAAQRRLTAPLSIAALLLGLLCLALFGGFGRGVRWATPRAPAPLPAQRTATLPPPVALERYAPVWQQPLFSPDRKPVVHAASGGSQLGDMQLTGIILTPALRMALLHDKRDREADRELRVREGARLPDGSWTLVEVKPRSAVFDSASGRVELELPVAAAIDVGHGSAGESGEAPPVPDQLQDERPGHRLQPPETDEDQTGASPTGAAPEEDDEDRGGTAAAPAGAASGTTMSNDARQAERLRLLRAAIEKRRAEQAAAKAHEGDR